MAVNVVRNDIPLAMQWTNAVGSVELPAFRRVEIRYDRRADVLSIRLRDGDPKYVVVGRGTFVLYADDGGIWAVDFEAEGWDVDVDGVFPLIGVETW